MPDPVGLQNEIGLLELKSGRQPGRRRVWYGTCKPAKQIAGCPRIGAA
jgi:hypothetical protein